MPDPYPAAPAPGTDASPPATRAPTNAPVLLPPEVNAAQRPSLAALFRAEEGALLRFGTGLVGRRSVAEELVQETFLRLHRVWDQVENPRAWLYRSLRNLALNHLRDHPAEVEARDDLPATEASLPADQLGRDEAVGTVRLCLAELPRDDRQLILLKYREGLRYRDISRRTGLSVTNVGYRLHFLLKGLADELRRCGIEGSQG